MKRLSISRPSPALIISIISLFVALGGVGYAAATGSIDSREIKNNSVRSKDVRNGTLVAKDIKKSTRDAFSAVPGGAVTGGKLGNVVTRTADSAPTTDADGAQNGPFGPVNTATATANCAAGERLLGGGAKWLLGNDGNNENLYLNESYPQGNGWVAEGIVDFGAQGQARIQAIALCLQ